MAKICENIICGEKYFFINKKNELVCRSNNHTEEIMTGCCDFDAVVEDECIHIAAAEKSGNLVYIINSKGHWGRGVAASGKVAENLFIQREQGVTVVYYVCGDGFYKICVGAADGQPVLLDKILYRAMPFVCGKRVYYINKEEMLCTNERQEICAGGDITHIFATTEYLCVKNKNRLELISTSDFDNKQSLTRRHGGSAQCPVIVSAGDSEILCWCDGDNVFFSKRTDGIWHSLETNTVQNAERPGIYKFDGKYDLGCMKNGQICSLNIKAQKSELHLSANV